MLQIAAVASGAENFEPDSKVVYKTAGEVTLLLIPMWSVVLTINR